MFTGIIEATGQVTMLEERGEQARLVIAAPFAGEVETGESVATNGCCLTVVEQSADEIHFDVLRQTLEVTSLGTLVPGRLVNLERALAANGRLSGHFVQGHVDTTGRILDLSPHGQDHRLEVALPPEAHRYCVSRGSLAVDGISLTIAELRNQSALFWIIPHTFSNTNLQDATVGSPVNLEVDLLAKYTEKLLRDRTN